MNKQNTVFQTEAEALLKATESLLQDNNIKNNTKPIIFYSDSQALVKALNKEKIYTEYIKQCILNLNELGKHTKVIVKWIPGHKGHEGNEKADKLANEGKDTENQDNTKYLIPISFVEKKLKQYYEKGIIQNYNLLNTEARIITDEIIKMETPTSK